MSAPRRPYFPTYSETFPLWMCHETICAEFLKLFANHGKPVKLTGKPQKEQPIDLGAGIRGVRFDVVAEDTDYHIYCIDSQRVFFQESYTDRTLFYGCVAMAAKSLRKNEDFNQLRPVTVIFIYIDNTASTESIDVINLYKLEDVKSGSRNIQPYNCKLTLIDINLNNRANCKTEDQFESDIRAFMDLMSIGDDEHFIKLISEDPSLSDSMRNVIKIFSELMSNVIQQTPIDNKQYTPYLDEILRKDVFKMTTGQMIRLEGEQAGEAKGIFKGKIELYYTELKLQPHEIAKKLKITEPEVNRILVELNLLSPLDEILKQDAFAMTTGQLLKRDGRIEGMVHVYYTKLNLKPHEIAKEMKITEDEVHRILIELKLVS